MRMFMIIFKVAVQDQDLMSPILCEGGKKY